VRLDPASAGPTAARLLLDLVSVYTPPGEEHRALPVIEEWASRLGLEAGVDRHGNIVVAPPEWGGALPVALLASHVDTVPGMLEARLDGGVVWGRGAVDAKGPLAAMIVGLALAAGELECSAAAAALLGEERDSRGAWALLASGETPPFIVIGEPTGGDGVAVGYRGSLRLTLECRGEEGHAASVEGGAAWELVELLHELRGDGDPGALTMLRAGEAWNVVPPQATAVLDKRYTGSGADGLAAAARACSKALSRPCGCRRMSLMAPVRVPLSAPVPRSLVAALRGEGVKPRVTVKHGTSDMNILYWGSRSIAAYGPGDPRLAHTRGERVSVEELGRAARVYAATLKSLCRRAPETLRS